MAEVKLKDLVVGHFSEAHITMVVLETATHGERLVGTYADLEELRMSESREFLSRRVKSWAVVRNADGIHLRIVVYRSKQ